MVLSKDIDAFYHKYGWVDGIITSIRWDNNLFDLLIDVYSYEGKGVDGRDLTIRFKNCLEANFAMTKCFRIVPRDELKEYMLSWYTITGYDVKEDNGLIAASIKTIDDNPRWLTLVCEEIWVEDEKE